MNQDDTLKYSLLGTPISLLLKGSYCAKFIGDLHEETNNEEGQPQDEEDMDRHNNAVGLDIGASGGDCANGCDDALKDGNLIVLKQP